MNLPAILLVYSLNIGFVPRGIDMMQLGDSTMYIDYRNAVKTKLDSRLIFKDRFFLGGSVETYALPHRFDFTPLWAEFEFSTGIQYKFLEAGYRHDCIHPIQSADKSGVELFSGRDELFVLFQGAFKVR